MEYIINCAEIKTKEEFHAILAQTLSFPSWYSNNLDALHDILTSISSETHIVLENWDELAMQIKHFKVVFDASEEENDLLFVTYQ